MWGGGWYWENFKNYFEAGGYTCLTPTLRYHDTDPGSEPSQNVEKSATIMTDDFMSYRGLGKEFAFHYVINHGKRE